LIGLLRNRPTRVGYIQGGPQKLNHYRVSLNHIENRQ